MAALVLHSKSIEQILFLVITFETAARIQRLDGVIKDDPKNGL